MGCGQRFLGALLLILALPIAWLGALTLRSVSVLADPQVLAETLPWPLVRDQGLIPAARRQVAELINRLPPDNPALFAVRVLNAADEATWQEAVDALLPQDKVRPLLVDTLAQGLAWITHPSPGTPENLDLTPWKQVLTQGTDAALEVVLNHLRPCNFVENAQLAQAALQGRWDTAPLCRPPQQVVALAWTPLAQEVQDAVQRLPDQRPWREVLPAEVTARLRQVFLVGPLLGWGLVALGGLLALIGAGLLATTWGGRLAWLGGAVAVYGGGLWALARWGLAATSSLLARQLPAESVGAMVAFEALARPLWQAMWAPVTSWTFALVGIGGGAILIGLAWMGLGSSS